MSVTLTCTSGTILGEATRTITEGAGTTYTVVEFIPGNPSCTATEDLADLDLVGYTADQSDCDSVPLTIDGDESCTIVNTLQAIPEVGKVVDEEHPNIVMNGDIPTVQAGDDFHYIIRVLNQGDEEGEFCR